MSYHKGDTNQAGFTLVELVLILVILTVLSVTAAQKWPSGMNEQAAKSEFKQAVRYAHHMAMTREWSTAASGWSISTVGNRYFIGRADAGCQIDCSNPECGDEMMCDRALLGDTTIDIDPTSGVSTVIFDDQGRPVDSSGSDLASVTFTIAGTELLTICAQTGYVVEKGSCP